MMVDAAEEVHHLAHQHPSHQFLAGKIAANDHILPATGKLGRLVDELPVILLAEELREVLLGLDDRLLLDHDRLVLLDFLKCHEVLPLLGSNVVSIVAL